MTQNPDASAKASANNRGREQAPYWMPPEWARHERTLVSWPVQDSMCQPADYVRVCAGYAAMVAAIAEFEPVTVLVNPNRTQEVREQVRAAAAAADGQNLSESQIPCNSQNPSNRQTLPGISRHPVDFLEIPHNDSWVRDNGPTFVHTRMGTLAGINWRFNAWGGKYAPWDLDDAVAPAVLAAFGRLRVDAPLVMEGGSFHTDGEGTLLTTRQCLCNANRNPDLSEEAIAAQLRHYLGVEKIIWLEDGLDGDETDGHIDNLACFAAPGKILLQVCHDPEDPNASVTEAALSVLSRERDAMGRAIEVVRIPQPPRRMGPDGRLTLSYLNFYFVNDGLVVPVFGGDAEAADREALRLLSGVFPDRRIRAIDGMAIVTEGGNVHCATQQVPVAAASTKHA